MARGRLKAKRDQLEAALVGVLIASSLHADRTPLADDTLDEAITRASQEIAQRLYFSPDPAKADASQAAPDQQPGAEPETSDREDQEEEEDPPSLTSRQAIVLLCSIPGISQRAAAGILAEIGIDMSRFPTPGHLASWAGMCPGNRESAGKRLSQRTEHPAVPGYANSWWKLLMPQLIPSRPICQRNIIAWLGDEARRKRYLRWATASWSSSTIYWING